MAKVYLRHVYRLPRHCAGGIDRYLERIGKTRDDITGPDAPGIDSEWLRAQGGSTAQRLADWAEEEAAAAAAGGEGSDG